MSSFQSDMVMFVFYMITRLIESHSCVMWLASFTLKTKLLNPIFFLWPIRYELILFLKCEFPDCNREYGKRQHLKEHFRSVMLGLKLTTFFFLPFSTLMRWLRNVWRTITSINSWYFKNLIKTHHLVIGNSSLISEISKLEFYITKFCRYLPMFLISPLKLNQKKKYWPDH